MLLKCFVLLCSVVSCLSQEKTHQVGDACIITHYGARDVPGSCQPISSCPYAIRLLFEDEVRPPMCWWKGETRIVCCPLHSLRRPSQPNCFFRSDRQQSLPIEAEPLPEETGCPPLDKPEPPPTLTAVQLIAWNKCVENLRYVRPCDKHQLVRNETCGIPTVWFRLHGARPAEPGEFPHMALLGVVKDCANRSSGSDDAEWVSAGALVSDRFVLTAAHVLVDPDQRPLRYALMSNQNKKGDHSDLLHIIVRWIPHDLYEWPNKQHDIALLELERRVTLSSFVRPICLPVPGQVTDREERNIAGWRHIVESADASQVLYPVQVTLNNNSECQTKYETPSFHYNASTMLCVKGHTCISAVSSERCENYYTSGPLMALLSNVPCSYRVEGVASFGPSCGKGFAGVYTRVEHYLDWIVRNVWPDEWQRAMGASN